MDITEDDWHAWKHHPVTKVYLRYLAMYEADLTQHQVQSLRQMVTAPDPFQLGVFKGECNAVANLAALEFGVLVDAFTSQEPQEGAHAA